MLLNNSTSLHSPLQPSPGTKANVWSSLTWCYCSASSFVTTSFPTTSTCARLFPVVTWPLTPTCLAHVPPVTSLRMNQSAKIRRPAATARTRQVGGSCCCEVRWLSCTVWCGIKVYTRLLLVQQDTGLSESMEIDHNSSANFDEVQHDNNFSFPNVCKSFTCFLCENWSCHTAWQMFSPPMHCESKGSPSPEKPAPEQDSKASSKDKGMDPAFPQLYDQPRHIQYATHFPIPQVRPRNNRENYTHDFVTISYFLEDFIHMVSPKTKLFLVTKWFWSKNHLQLLITLSLCYKLDVWSYTDLINSGHLCWFGSSTHHISYLLLLFLLPGGEQ